MTMRAGAWKRPLWMMLALALAAAAAGAVGIASEYGWLWGHPERGVALAVVTVLAEIGLLVWLVATLLRRR